MKLPPGIEIVDDAFNFGADIIEMLDEQDRWARSELGAHRGQSDKRTSSSCFFPFCSYRNPPLIEGLARRISGLLDNYSTLYGVGYDMVESVAFNRYEAGQSFAVHPDYFKGSDRVVSVVAYLNTIERGGATRFVHFDLDVKPVAGRVVLFPSNFLFAHEGAPPTDETKYSAAFWARG